MNNFQSIAAFMDDVLVKDRGIPGCEIIVMQDHQVKFRHQSGKNCIQAPGGIILGKKVRLLQLVAADTNMRFCIVGMLPLMVSLWKDLTKQLM